MATTTNRESYKQDLDKEKSTNNFESSGSDQDEDPFVIERRRNRLRVETVRAQLHALLAQPIFPRGFSFKYPNSEAAQLATSHTQSAVETMKAAIEDQKQAKKDRNKRKRNA